MFYKLKLLFLASYFANQLVAGNLEYKSSRKATVPVDRVLGQWVRLLAIARNNQVDDIAPAERAMHSRLSGRGYEPDNESGASSSGSDSDYVLVRLPREVIDKK